MACYEKIPLKASYFKSLTGKEKLAGMKAKKKGLMVFNWSHGQCLTLTMTARYHNQALDNPPMLSPPLPCFPLLSFPFPFLPFLSPLSI